MYIDYVIAWVDGNDPAHRDARRKFQPPDDLKGNDQAVGDVRYAESGEIYYSIAAVLKYAPFIRRLFIVTDGQTPKLLDEFFRDGKCDPSFIRIVSHDEIFSGLEAARPNFSSLSIESALWKIPDLAENFIYANDDFFFNSPASAKDFFIDGKPVLRGKWCKPEGRLLKNIVRRHLRKWTGRAPNANPTFRKSLNKGAVVAGIADGFLGVGHHPHPLRQSTFEDFFRRHPDVLNQQVGHRYRHADQFNPVSLANHLEILYHRGQYKPPAEISYLDCRKNKDIDSVLSELEDDTTKYGCVQSIENFSFEEFSELNRILTNKFKDQLPNAISRSLRQNSQAISGVAYEAGWETQPQ